MPGVYTRHADCAARSRLRSFTGELGVTREAFLRNIILVVHLPAVLAEPCVTLERNDLLRGGAAPAGHLITGDRRFFAARLGAGRQGFPRRLGTLPDLREAPWGLRDDERDGRRMGADWNRQREARRLRDEIAGARFERFDV